MDFGMKVKVYIGIKDGLDIEIKVEINIIEIKVEVNINDISWSVNWDIDRSWSIVNIS